MLIVPTSVSRYVGTLPDHLKQDILARLFNSKWMTYRQAHRTRLDREMYDNELCCTYPEECSGQHSSDVILPRSEATVLWKILQVRAAQCLF
jgi:hypothetical protein